MTSAALKIRYWQSPLGEMILGTKDEQLCLCDWRYRRMRSSINKRLQAYFNSEFTEGDSATGRLAIQQLEEYFSGDRQSFDLPLSMAGSSFQQGVWQALQNIPFGKTQSYLQLSEQLGNRNAIRAVASANGANALAIIVPCHRIIGSQGELVGYAGGLAAKQKLLQLEARSRQTNLFA